MAAGACTQGEGMDVRAHRVGRFSSCCFLAGTSLAGDAAGRNACWARDVTGCRQTRSYGKHMAGNPVPDGYLLPFPQLLHTQAGSAQRCGRTPTGDSPEASPGSTAREGWAGCRWHGLPALCSRAEMPCRAQAAPLGHQCSELCTGSARTEPAEHTRLCLAGHGLKLGLGGQNLANELMAINSRALYKY